MRRIFEKLDEIGYNDNMNLQIDKYLGNIIFLFYFKLKIMMMIILTLNHYINRTRLYLQMYKNNSPVTLNAKLQSLAKDINDISSMLEKKQITPKQLAFYYSGDPDQPVNVSNIKKTYLAKKDAFTHPAGTSHKRNSQVIINQYFNR